MEEEDVTEEGEDEQPSHCAICGRPEELTRHHLIPRSRHRKARTKRSFSKDEMRSMVIWICWPCHKNLHRCLTEQEMAETHHTLEDLKAHPDVEKFVHWIRHKPPGFLPAGM